MRAQLVIIFAFLITLSACKTQEEIQREQMVDNISLQMVERQKQSADANQKLQEFEEKLSLVTGQIEEVQHNSSTKLEERNSELLGRIQTLETQLEAYKKEVDRNSATIRSQERYIKQVLSKLEGLAGGKTTPKKRAKKLSRYDQAMKDYQRGRYKSSKSALTKLFNENKIKGKRRLRIMHNLGMINFIQKDNDQALIFFSKLYTEAPKSTYNANGLLHLAKTFVRIGQKGQAKEALSKLITSFPKHKKAKEAKSYLKKI